MAYFPAFVQLDAKKILIVGGGEIAYEKLERLLDFTSDITVIAEKISGKMQRRITQERLSFELRAYEQGDIEGFSMVIVAVDDILLQEKIYKETQQSKCLCNAVDSAAFCDFIFPSYIKEDELTIAISTSGSSPAFAKHFKNYLRGVIPGGIAEFLKEMRTLRKTLPKGKERMQMLDEKAQKYIKAWGK